MKEKLMKALENSNSPRLNQQAVVAKTHAVTFTYASQEAFEREMARRRKGGK